MAEMMSLQQVRDQIHAFSTATDRNGTAANYYVEMNVLVMDEWWKAIDANLAQPAQAVDVGEPSKQEVDALSRCVVDLERFIELAKDYDLDEMAVQSLQTAIESMQMRAARAIGNAQAESKS